ncbi:MAG TPA: NADP-dependent oxidoreductase [Chloroflexota bacterium]
MSGDTMRAARFHEYGAPDVLVVDQVPRPEPQEGTVLVRVHAAGVNPIEWKLRAGYLKEYMPVELPHTPGYDLAGTVEAIGPGVTGFAPGQAVFGRGMGTYADYAVAPTTSLAPKPDNITFDQAATIAIGSITAWTGLFDAADLQAGQRLLVQGAAGGTGSYAVQLGRWKGAHVTGTASSRNLEFVRSLGAEEVIDYTTTSVEEAVSGVDVVFDTVGGEVMDRSWQLLKPSGILVEVAGMPNEDTARQHGVRTSGVQAPPDVSDILRQIADLIRSGAVMAEVGAVFPLDEAAQAQALSQTGHGRGRIVLHIAD